MTDLEEFHELVHFHLVALFLLLDKHIKMLIREVLKKRRGSLFLQLLLKISPEVIIQLEENLKTCLKAFGVILSGSFKPLWR